jgi:opacity protein-like surface antigen
VPTPSRIALCILLLTGTSAVLAQTPRPQHVDLGVTYIAQRSLRASTTQNFWLEGGSAELGLNLWHGFGAAANVTDGHTGSIGSSGVPLTLLTATFGPRYRWHPAKRTSVYGEGLFGVAHGSDSAFPAPGGVQPSANSFAWQLSGGVDYRLSHHFAVRALDIGYLHAALPNGASNVQNLLRVGAGVAFRFGR